tara:strand:+ start:991 stop:1875 length:885 start_codon:yes stop_codon:yes gene_type:complete
MTITLRQESATGATTKGSSLTYAELDNNFKHLLRQGTVMIAGDSGTQRTLGEADKDSTLIFAGGTNVTTVVSEPDSAGATTVTFNATSSGGLSNVVEDTSPQLGGDLDMNGQDIVTTSNADIELAPNGTGHVVVKGNTNSGIIQLNCEANTHGQQIQAQPHSAGVTNELLLPGGANSTLVSEDATQTLKDKTFQDYAETVEAIGSNDSPTLTVANGNVKTVTISSALNLPAFSDAAAGQTITLIVSGSGTAAPSGGAAYKFAGGNKTLTNDSIVSIHTPDATNYFASIATNFTA